MRQANSQLFGPHGLYAIVIAFNSQQPQIYIADHSYSYPNPLAFSAESQLSFAAPLIFSESESSAASPETARRQKSHAKNPQKQPNSRKRIGHRSNGLPEATLKGVFLSRFRELRSVSSVANGMMMSGPQEHGTSGQPFGSGETDQVRIHYTTSSALLTYLKDTLFLLIVYDTPESIGFIPASHGTQPFQYYQYHERPVLQVATSNRPRVYAPNEKGYSTGTFDTFGHVPAQQHDDPPPAYDHVIRTSYDRT